MSPTNREIPIRVLVVDDSAFMRRALSAIVESDAELELVGTAFNGRNALKKIDQLEPDVVTLDVEMPELDGIGALKELMATHEHPPAVLMCSSLTREGSRVALDALQHGAADVIAKPTTAHGLHESPDARLMLSKIRGVAKHRKRFKRHAEAQQKSNRPRCDEHTSEAPPICPAATRSLKRRAISCVVVGSSTGGPPALEAMLAHLPATLPVPIVIAQHMPPMFTQSLAARLDSLAEVSVLHAETGMPLLPGKVYVAQGGRHMRVARAGAGRSQLEITTEPSDVLYKPSVSVLFESAVHAFGDKTLGVMLTGMGDDGLAGSRALVEAGGLLLGQNEASCVVYGMPKAVHEAGLVHAQFDPPALGQAIAHITATTADRGGTRDHAA